MPELTAAERFARCLDHILAFEGGYADHPKDPGGATNMGITHKTLARWRKVSPWWKLSKNDVRALGRDEAAIQGSYQLHPLWSLSGLALWNAVDGSALFSPSFAYSASDSASVSGGMFFGFGPDELPLTGELPSEYGLVPATAYVSVSFFF